MRIALLFALTALALASNWEYVTPEKDFSVTLPFSAAHDVGTFNVDKAKRTGFYIDSVVDKELFKPCPDVREFGVWSEPYTDEASYRKFVTSKFGSPQGATETPLKFGAFTGFQLERGYKGYKGVQTYERVVGVHTPTTAHSFYCMWHKNAKDPAVMAFFTSIKSTR